MSEAQELTVSDFLADAELAESTQLAEESREVIAAKLELIATQVRAGMCSPINGIIVTLEPQGRAFLALGTVTWSTIDEVNHVLTDLGRLRYSYPGKENKSAAELIADGYERRKQLRLMQQEKEASHVAEFPFKCPHCNKRCRTRKGQEQHTAYNVKIGCACGTPRCDITRRGKVLYDNDHYRGRFVCGLCFRT